MRSWRPARWRKFLGDGFMAMFGAPANDPYQEEHAICAALEMLRREPFRVSETSPASSAG